MSDTPIVLGERFEEAVLLALSLHRHQARKGTTIPYASHLMSVASLALEHGASEDEAIAALLHDAVEDCGAEQLLDIRNRFGSVVADIVAGCTDSQQEPKPPWKERKERYLAHLSTAKENVLLVACADKLHNARCILIDYREHGVSLWSRFRGGREGVLWYYGELVTTLRGAGAPTRLVDELARTLAVLQDFVQSEGTDAAPP